MHSPTNQPLSSISIWCPSIPSCIMLIFPKYPYTAPSGVYIVILPSVFGSGISIDNGFCCSCYRSVANFSSVRCGCACVLHQISSSKATMLTAIITAICTNTLISLFSLRRWFFVVLFIHLIFSFPLPNQKNYMQYSACIFLSARRRFHLKPPSTPQSFLFVAVRISLLSCIVFFFVLSCISCKQFFCPLCIPFAAHNMQPILYLLLALRFASLLCTLRKRRNIHLSLLLYILPFSSSLSGKPCCRTYANKYCCITPAYLRYLLCI